MTIQPVSQNSQMQKICVFIDILLFETKDGYCIYVSNVWSRQLRTLITPSCNMIVGIRSISQLHLIRQTDLRIISNR